MQACTPQPLDVFQIFFYLPAWHSLTIPCPSCSQADVGLVPWDATEKGKLAGIMRDDKMVILSLIYYAFRVVVDLALNQVAKAWFHRSLDPAGRYHLWAAFVFRKMYRGTRGQNRQTWFFCLTHNPKPPPGWKKPYFHIRWHSLEMGTQTWKQPFMKP